MHNRMHRAQIEIFRAPSKDPIVSGTLTGRPEDLLAAEMAINHVGDIRAHITVSVPAATTGRLQSKLPNRLVAPTPAITVDEKVQSFMHELFDLYDRHNLALSHEDSQGAFIIQNKSDTLIDWMKQVQVDKEVLPTQATLETDVPSRSATTKGPSSHDI